jgi:hypothetical protein
MRVACNHDFSPILVEASLRDEADEIDLSEKSHPERIGMQIASFPVNAPSPGFSLVTGGHRHLRWRFKKRGT